MKNKLFLGALTWSGFILFVFAGRSNGWLGSLGAPFARQENQTMGTAIAFQGSLQDENGPVSGTCDLRFALFNTLEGGSPIGSTQNKPGVQIVDGYFTVYNLDFGAGAFNGSQRFLEISVRCPAGSGSYAQLEPRQELTPAPYALAIPGLWTLPNQGSYNLIGGSDENEVRANVRGGTIGGGGTDWLPNIVTDDYGTIAGGEDNQAGDDDTVNDNAEHSTVSGGLSNTAAGSGSSIGGGTGNQALGSQSSISGGSGNVASGVGAAIGGGGDNQASGEFNATIAGGYGNIAAETDSTVGGGNTNYSDQWAATVSGGYSNNAAGAGAAVSGGESNVASGDMSAVSGGQKNLAYGLNSTVSGGASNQVYADFGTIGGGGSFESDNSNIVEVDAGWGTIAGGDRNNISAAYGFVGGGFKNSVSGNHGSVAGGSGNVASGSLATVPGGYNNKAQGNYSFAAGNNALAQHNGSFVWADAQGAPFASGAPNQFAVRAYGGVYFATGESAVSVNVLKIRGGSDFAELFTISGGVEIQPGTVVSIDPHNPGQLRVSTAPADRLVAGCVSGANGVDSGLIMQQEGSPASGSVPVALSGRVYCRADATGNPIVPGDLLTTAALPGHLTAVTDYEQAQGAVVGKAMSGLDAGQGFVLVLISLQ